MLNIKTIKNHLAGEDKDGFCFRSTCSQTLTEQQLIAEMTAYNSTFTEADTAGIMAILKTTVFKYLAKGYAVELPFGTLRVTASGTCDGMQASFSPGMGNHAINYIITPSLSLKNHVETMLEYQQILPDPSRTTRIYRLCTLQDDASKSKDLTLAVGSLLRIHGRNLSFDFSDDKQGIFLDGEDNSTRIVKYIRTGSNIVDFLIPTGTTAGSYKVRAVTKPGISYFTADIDTAITVTA